jgi:hypothetical protein
LVANREVRGIVVVRPEKERNVLFAAAGEDEQVLRNWTVVAALNAVVIVRECYIWILMRRQLEKSRLVTPI